MLSIDLQIAFCRDILWILARLVFWAPLPLLFAVFDNYDIFVPMFLFCRGFSENETTILTRYASENRDEIVENLVTSIVIDRTELPSSPHETNK